MDALDDNHHDYYNTETHPYNTKLTLNICWLILSTWVSMKYALYNELILLNVNLLFYFISVMLLSCWRQDIDPATKVTWNVI